MTSGGWLLSLGMMSWRFIHVAAFWWCSMVWIYRFVLHSPDEGYGLFPFFPVIVNKASMNVYVKKFSAYQHLFATNIWLVISKWK